MQPDTVVLVHGFWVTPRAWENWIAHYEDKGFRVIAPAYPGFEAGVEALNADPAAVETVTVPAVVSALEKVIADLDRPPVIMGHSAGGAFTQILLDRGFGAAGVAINSAPTEGVAVSPLSRVRPFFPVPENPADRHRAVGFDYAQWRHALTNTFSEGQARTAYERHHVPAPGSIVWGSALATLHPGHTGTYVDYRNLGRAPLLFCSGEHDHLMPPQVQRSNAERYRADGATTEVTVFPGRSHLMPVQDNWQEIADHALDWALAHS
ncbi:alpha/beta hydrolase [Streptomyces sp. MI02-7b]|uniref:alpha/beta hydrolase n=1 Tax=Streptomyces sp. MI02-7b TaxID=462941 RepID=UPI0029A3C65A|nr:alpha/beta hydrolase [Streptomyces sp. MI02-7b]MDX3075562.1 alpha/beta hydrolase [Streptomyces sp. MI02-7b]